MSESIYIRTSYADDIRKGITKRCSASQHKPLQHSENMQMESWFDVFDKQLGFHTDSQQ